MFGIYNRRPVWEITDSSLSGLDRDSPQTSKISLSVKTGYIAGDFDLTDPVDSDVAEALGEQLRQSLIARPDSLSLLVVRVDCGRVPGKEIRQRAYLHYGFSLNQSAKITSVGGRALSLIRKGKKLERAIGLAGIHEAFARPFKFLPER